MLHEHERSALHGYRAKLRAVSNADTVTRFGYRNRGPSVAAVERIARRVSELEDLDAGAAAVSCTCSPGLRFVTPHVCGRTVEAQTRGVQRRAA